jgi:Plasmid replication region DNA-binding N-term
MSATENPRRTGGRPDFAGLVVPSREGAITALDVQRAADALLRQGTKPSVAALREQLGGGSPNTITPLLAKHWETLGARLGAGPNSLERVPASLARVTELLWRRALDEARERLKILGARDESGGGLVELQEQVMKLSVALAEARAREGKQLTHLASLSKERETLRTDRASLLALVKGTQELLEEQNARVAALERSRNRKLLAPAKSARSRARKGNAAARSPRLSPARSGARSRNKTKARKPK